MNEKRFEGNEKLNERDFRGKGTQKSYNNSACHCNQNNVLGLC